MKVQINMNIEAYSVVEILKASSSVFSLTLLATHAHSPFYLLYVAMHVAIGAAPLFIVSQLHFIVFFFWKKRMSKPYTLFSIITYLVPLAT
jgi:hypothetical protein